MTRVEMTPDLKQARVYYETRPQVDETRLHQALDKAMGFIKQEVARENLFRLMPEIFFLPDRGLDEAERLEQLFHEAGISGSRREGSDN